MTAFFYWTGALVWTCWAIVVVAGLLWWALGVLWPTKRTPAPAPAKPVDVWRMGPFLNPHPWPTETVYHVDTNDVEQAWRVIGGRAS